MMMLAPIYILGRGFNVDQVAGDRHYMSLVVCQRSYEAHSFSGNRHDPSDEF